MSISSTKSSPPKPWEVAAAARAGTSPISPDAPLSPSAIPVTISNAQHLSLNAQHLSPTYSPAPYVGYGHGSMRPYNKFSPAGGFGNPSYSMMPMMGPNGPHSMMNSLHGGISRISRFSDLLHANFDSLHVSFTSFASLVSNLSQLSGELRAFLSTCGSLRLIYLLYDRIHRFLRRVAGYNDPHSLASAWNQASTSGSNGSQWGWVPTCLSITAIIWIVRRLIRTDPNAVFPPSPDPYQIPNAGQAIPPNSQYNQPFGSSGYGPPGYGSGGGFGGGYPGTQYGGGYGASFPASGGYGAGPYGHQPPSFGSGWQY